MSIIAPGLVAGPALFPQPPLVPSISAPQPVDAASGSKTDSGTSRQQDGGSAFLSGGGRKTDLTYDRPGASQGTQGFVNPVASSGTASADVAAINSPAVSADPPKSPAYAAASAAYEMVAGAPAGMPPSVLTPLRES